MGAEDKPTGPGASRKLDVAAGAGGLGSALLPPSKLAGGAGSALASTALAASGASRLAALSGGEGRRYIEYTADVSGTARLAASDAAARLEAVQAAKAMVPKANKSQQQGEDDGPAVL